MTPAERLWKAELEHTQLEDELITLLTSIFTATGFASFTTDHYDRSLEIYGVARDRKLSSDELQALADFGLGQVWTHSSLLRHDAGDLERHYSLPDARPAKDPE